MSVEIDLEGRVALVTGAGAGIGREIARWLARAGAAVAVNDIVAERAEETVDELVGEGVSAVAVVADVTDPDQAAALPARVGERLGDLRIAVNNVGMMAGRPARRFTESVVEDVVAVVGQNLLGTYQCCLAEARAMLQGPTGGVIVNVSSGETTRPAVGLAAYGAAKAAINHLTMTLATELGPSGIRVNAVAPGTTFTEQVRAAMGEEQFVAISESTPLRRVCEPDELGRLVVFLCSDLARCITGQLVLADAGAHLGRRPLSVEGLR